MPKGWQNAERLRGLVVSGCSHDAAAWAVEHWHYSGIMPTGKAVKYGVWEDTGFIGAVIYSRGASPYLGRWLGLESDEVCELTRIALDAHDVAVSHLIARTARDLAQTNPGLRAIISFADPVQGHSGRIYQASNWLYTGMSKGVREYRINGRWRHLRGAYYHPARPGAPMRTAPGKHRYVWPLDKQIRRRVSPHVKRYPS